MQLVNSVQSFLLKLENITNTIKSDSKHDNILLTYRGHEIESWKLEPSLYRKGNSNKIRNEHNYINDAVINFPNDLESHRTNFEKLAFFQHYGFPTRLLDLTENPLVSLYFACQKNTRTKQNASVEVLAIEKSLLKYYNSDSVSVLSAFSRLNNTKIRDIKSQFESHLLRSNDSDIKKLCKVNAGQQQTLLEMISSKYSTLKESTQKEIDYQLNKTENINFLYHEIKYEKSHFEHKIKFEDFDNRILCVKTKMSNPRILAQQGLFLLFGIYNSNKMNMSKINSAKYKKLIHNKKITIDINSKEKILKELDLLGINQKRLFPEFLYSGKSILNQY
ncbi:MAG: FRG domain-containing protein [Sulfurimonadaceae bacterium]